MYSLIYFIFSVERGHKVAVLLKFVAEGDNALDSVELVSYLNSWKGWVNLKVNLLLSLEKLRILKCPSIFKWI